MEFILEGDTVLKITKIKTQYQEATEIIFYDMIYHTKLNFNNGIIKAAIYNYLNELQIDKNIEVPFILDEQEIVVQSNNGIAEIEFNSIVAGEYIIRTNISNYRNGEIKVVIE